MKLKYRVIPQGAADGGVPLNWAFIDKKDIILYNIKWSNVTELYPGRGSQALFYIV